MTRLEKLKLMLSYRKGQKEYRESVPLIEDEIAKLEKINEQTQKL